MLLTIFFCERSVADITETNHVHLISYKAQTKWEFFKKCTNFKKQNYKYTMFDPPPPPDLYP
jgi:hypothetical protein